MARKRKGPVYCVHYSKRREEEVFELHARYVGPSDLLGFVTVRDFVFPKTNSPIITPSSDRVEREFKGVNETSIPISDIIRVDCYDEGALEVESSPLKVVALRGKSD